MDSRYIAYKREVSPRCETSCRLVCGYYQISRKSIPLWDCKGSLGRFESEESRIDMPGDGCILLGRKSSRRKSRG